MTDNRLTVLTYNIHKGFSTGNRSFVLHQIRSALQTADADVLFLQEMQGEHQEREQKVRGWPDCSQFEFLAHGIWPHYAYAKNATYSAGHHGNAILSKFPLLNWENINVSPFRWASRSLLHGVIRIPDGDRELHIICIHFGLLGAERQRQIESLCARIDSHVPHDAPLIVAGDFNDWSGEAERRFYRHLELQEAYRSLHGRHARTFPAWLPVLPMDRIYYRGLTPLSCERMAHAPWHRLSDHAPLAAVFRL
ncbi:MAG: endonuclease/exonuclease/phosphatase family protein [Gammaproteobacteria bacterium]